MLLIIIYVNHYNNKISKIRSEHSMYFTLFSYFTNIVYLLKTPINLKDKFAIFLTYSFLTIISIIPLLPKPKTVKIFNFQISGFNFHTLHYLFGEIFVKNEYFFKSNKHKPLILDCGSNIGVSVIYFKFLYPNCHIHAFEPDPETFELLKQNVQKNNLKNVFLHNKAVSNSEKDIDFYISEEKGNLMMSTLRERMSEAKIKVKSIY